jgi:hypothetical protein
MIDKNIITCNAQVYAVVVDLEHDIILWVQYTRKYTFSLYHDDPLIYITIYVYLI